MTNRDVACLGFRLMAIWLVAQALIGVAAIPYYWEPQFDGVRLITVLFTMLPVVVSAAIGVPLWGNAEWLAAHVFPEEASPASPQLSQEALFSVALAVIGVLLVCEAIPALVNGLALFVQSRSAGDSILGPDPDQQALIWHAAVKANAASALARLVIGVAFLAGPSRLAAIYVRVRNEFRSTLAEEAAPPEEPHE